MNLTGLKKLQDDLDYGLPKEDPVIEKLSRYFDEKIERALEKYSPFDASSDNTKYEIKSRRNEYAKYPTTIIPVDKVQRIKGRIVFVFNFTDGLYYIEYNRTEFTKYEIKEVEAYRRNGVITSKPHFFIPIIDLIRISI
jgi:hypothetical protein